MEGGWPAGPGVSASRSAVHIKQSLNSLNVRFQCAKWEKQEYLPFAAHVKNEITYVKNLAHYLDPTCVICCY